MPSRPARYPSTQSFWSWPCTHTQTWVALRVARHEGGIPTRQGDRVRFRISDIFLPSPAELPTELSQSPELEGEIVDFSDSGLELRVFAVVEISGLRTVVIPVSRLEVVEANPESD